MEIKELISPKINGKNEAFGGYIYNVDYSIGFSSEPSQIDIDFISEDGEYNPPELSYDEEYSISLSENNELLSYHAVEYTLTESHENKILRVTFLDDSVKLDTVYVGLNFFYGFNNDDGNTKSPEKFSEEFQAFGETNHLILLGREISPCDVNEDWVVDESDYEEILNRDSCDACPKTYEAKRLAEIEFDCDVDECFKIKEVKYSAKNLREGIERNNRISGLFDSESFVDDIFGNETILRDFTGTIREVMNQWADLFGYTFYLSEENKIRFANLREKIDIPSSVKISRADSVNQIVNFVEKKSILNTFARGIISNYAKDGEVKEYNCSRRSLKVLNSLKIMDTGAANDIEIPDTDGKFRDIDIQSSTEAAILNINFTKTVAVILSKYSEILRDAYYFFTLGTLISRNSNDIQAQVGTISNNAGIVDIDEANKYKGGYLPNLSGFDEKEIPEMGRFRILQVFGQGKNTTYNDGGFGDSFVEELTEAEKTRFFNYNGYFIVAQYSEEIHKRHTQEDSALVDFLGKYFIGTYTLYGDLPYSDTYKMNEDYEISISDVSYSVTAPDSASFYKINSDTVNSFPFSTVPHTSDSKIAALESRYISKNKPASKNEIEKNFKGMKGRGLIVAEKSGNYIPSSFEGHPFIKRLMSSMELKLPALVGGDGRPQALMDYLDYWQVPDETKNDTTIKLFIVYPNLPENDKPVAPGQTYNVISRPSFEMTSSSNGNNPIEKESIKQAKQRLTEEQDASFKKLTSACPSAKASHDKIFDLDTEYQQLGIVSPNCIKLDFKGGVEKIEGNKTEVGRPESVPDGSDRGATIYSPASVLPAQIVRAYDASGKLIVSGGGYIVEIEETFKLTVPVKMERILKRTRVDGFEISPQTRSYSIKYSDITEDNLKTIKADAECEINGEYIEKLHQELNVNSEILQQDEDEEYSIETDNVPLDEATIPNGLQSISVSVSSSGIKYRYSFKNKYPLPLSKEIIEESIRKGKLNSNKTSVRTYRHFDK